MILKMTKRFFLTKLRNHKKSEYFITIVYSIINENSPEKSCKSVVEMLNYSIEHKNISILPGINLNISNEKNI